MICFKTPIAFIFILLLFLLLFFANQFTSFKFEELETKSIFLLDYILLFDYLF